MRNKSGYRMQFCEIKTKHFNVPVIAVEGLIQNITIKFIFFYFSIQNISKILKIILISQYWYEYNLISINISFDSSSMFGNILVRIGKLHPT